MIYLFFHLYLVIIILVKSQKIIYGISCFQRGLLKRTFRTLPKFAITNLILYNIQYLNMN